MKSRAYVMTARAESAARTRTEILQATIALAGRVPLSSISLASVAERAGVSVQTVLRQLGSRDELLDAAAETALAEVERERAVAPGDVAAAITTLVDHYEERGDGVLLLLGQESYDARAKRITDAGRRLHERWVATTFPGRSGREIDDLVVVTDVYAWKLLRRDRGLTPEATRDRMTGLVAAVTGGRADE